MVNTDSVLLDDGSLIEISRDVVRSCTDHLHSPVFRLLIGPGPDEGRKEGMMNVDQRDSDFLKKIVGDDLHVPGEHYEVDVSAQ